MNATWRIAIAFVAACQDRHSQHAFVQPPRTLRDPQEEGTLPNRPRGHLQAVQVSPYQVAEGEVVDSLLGEES